MAAAEPVGHESDELHRQFDGAVVMFFLAGRGDALGQTLERIQVRYLGGRLVIIGKAVKDGRDGDFLVDQTVGIPWDSVKMFYIMTHEYFELNVKGKGVSADQHKEKLGPSSLLSD